MSAKLVSAWQVNREELYRGFSARNAVSGAAGEIAALCARNDNWQARLNSATDR